MAPKELCGDMLTISKVCKEEIHNPIQQDVSSNGKPRELADIPPFHGYPCNYGAFPQVSSAPFNFRVLFDLKLMGILEWTWEDPTTADRETGINGDDDPLDVCEISTATTPATCGQIKIVKPLGALVVIDQGETDWKVIAIDVTDPIVSMLRDIGDVERCLPGLLDSLKNWYRQYKVPEGKGENEIGLGGELKNQRYAFLCAAV